MRRETAEIPSSLDEVADRFAPVMQRSFWVVVALVVALAWWNFEPVTFSVTASAVLLIVLCLLPAFLYARRRVYGMPIVPALCANELLWFAMPAITGHESLRDYTDGQILKALWTEIAFVGVLLIVWHRFVSVWPARMPGWIHTFRRQNKGLASSLWFWIALLAFCTIYTILNTMGQLGALLRPLPNGVASLLRAVVGAGGMLSMFFLGFCHGHRLGSVAQRTLYVALASLLLLALGSDTVLASIIPFLLAGVAGYSLGSGRIPWKLLVVLALFLNVLHLGKYEMRLRYWPQFLGTAQVVSPLDYPTYYGEWMQYGWRNLNGMGASSDLNSDRSDLLERASLLHMVLYAQERAPEFVPYLNGRTIWIVPQLMAPRILWPNKPRTHEGQIILNVHFGMQDAYNARQTNIAWGQLAEFYANFGLLGAPMLGVFLGLVFGFISRLTIGMPLDSLRFLLGVVFLVSGITATQLSLAVWVTSVQQACIVVLLGALLFARRQPLGEDAPEPTPVATPRQAFAR